MDTVLVVDDERAVRDALDRALRLSGYAVETAEHGLDGLAKLASVQPAVIVLDVSMPGVDGLGMARRMRADGDRTPILMLTARDAVGDRVAGLDAGADDYLVKPFALEELLARLRALLRRTTRPDDAPATVLRFEDVSMDTETRRVTRGERAIELTNTEFLLLELFLENPRRVLERDVLLDRVWGFDSGTSSNALEVYVGYLRRKLEADDEPRLLRTVRGVGYQLIEP